MSINLSINLFKSDLFPFYICIFKLINNNTYWNKIHTDKNLDVLYMFTIERYIEKISLTINKS